MALRLLLDEDIKSKRLVRLLKEAGHDVVTTVDVGLDGQSDPTVLASAAKLGRTVLTYNCDDFRALHASAIAHAGILVVYQEPGKSMSYQEMLSAIENLEHSGISLQGSLFALNQWHY